MNTTVGLIGLGNAGAALAQPLVKAFTVFGFDINTERQHIAQSLGVQCVDSAAAVAQAADIVLLNLPKPEASMAVAHEVLGVAKLPALFIETSTVTPATAKELQTLCVAESVAFLDAAIAGGVAGMAAGKTTFLVGGKDIDLQTATPVLESMATTIRHMGPVGAGMGAKVVINAVYHALMVVLLEAVAMTKKLDIPIESLVDILKSSEGMMRPLTHRIEERVLGNHYQAGMSVSNARKDSVLAIQTAQDLGIPLYAMLASHTPYEIAETLGMGDQDYASLAKLWEQWCDITLSR